MLRRGGKAAAGQATLRVELDADDLEDLEDLPADEREETAEQILDQATAARSVTELKAEISTLRHVEEVARGVRRSGRDAKWRELAGLLGEIPCPRLQQCGAHDGSCRQRAHLQADAILQVAEHDVRGLIQTPDLQQVLKLEGQADGDE